MRFRPWFWVALISAPLILAGCSDSSDEVAELQAQVAELQAQVKSTTTQAPATTRATTTTQAPATTRATTTTRPKATTSVAESYLVPTIEIDCGETFEGAYEWYQPEFGGSWNWDLGAGFDSIAMDYGDGKTYTSGTPEDAEVNAYWHKYWGPGSYTVRATLTDGVGQKATASCVWTWEWVDSVSSTSTVASAFPDATFPSEPRISICYSNEDWGPPKPEHDIGLVQAFGDYLIAWEAPVSDGGAPIVSYELRYHDSGPSYQSGYFSDGDDDPYNNPTWAPRYFDYVTYSEPGTGLLQGRLAGMKADIKLVVTNAAGFTSEGSAYGNFITPGFRKPSDAAGGGPPPDPIEGCIRNFD